MRKNKSKGKRGGEKEPAPKAVGVVGVRAQAQPPLKAPQVVGAQAPAQPLVGVAPAQPAVVAPAQPLGVAPAQPLGVASAQPQPAPDAPKLSFLAKLINTGDVAGKLTDIDNKIKNTHVKIGQNLAAKQDEIKGNFKDTFAGFNNKIMNKFLSQGGGKSKKRARRTKKRARRTKKRSRSSTRRGSAPARHSRGSVSARHRRL